MKLYLEIHIQNAIEQMRWSFFVENFLTYYSSQKDLRCFPPLEFHKGILDFPCL